MKDLFAQGGSGSAGIKTNKQAIARRFGVKQSEVTYLNTTADLSQFAVLYDKVNQRAYPLPALPAGTVAISLVNGVLTHSGGTVDLGLLAAQKEIFENIKLDFSTGFTIESLNQTAQYDGTPYRWSGSLPKVVPADSTPDSTGGISAGNWVPAGIVSFMNVLADPTGAKMLGMPQGGTLAENIVTLSIDAFGADPTGADDSTPAVLLALESIYGVNSDSRYYASRTKYVQLLFGNGTYKLGDVPLISGTDYVGQGRWATRVIPKSGASYIFKTVGTLPAADAGGGGRYWCGHIRDMLIGDRYLSTGLPQNVGAIYMSNVSHFRLERVDIVNIDGCGLDLAACWDSQFYALKIVGTGNSRDSANPVPALRIKPVTGSGGVEEGSNALMFYGLHIELCPQQMQLDYVAHVLFVGGKFEGGVTATTSSSITRAIEVCFDAVELTWQKVAFPMFNMLTSGDSSNTGVHFSSPRLVSQAGLPSWYFYYNSDLTPLLISNITARNVSKLITGANFVIDGGITYNCGPTIANGGKGTRILDLVCKQVPAISTTADNTFILTSTESEVRGCYIQCAGTNSDGAACIQIASGATDAKVHNNVFTGAKQYGILQNGVVVSKFIRDNVIGPGGNIASLMTGSTPLYTLTSANSVGLGNGGVNGAAGVSVANGASTTLALASGATKMLVRGTYNSLTAAAEIFVDAGTSTIVVGAQTTSGGGTVIQTGTGAANDGSIRISKSGGNVTFTNYTGSALTLNITTLSAVA